MDYPTLCPITDYCGIDAISKYVEYISYEQKFMGALPQEYVYDVLCRFQTGYKKQFYNICSIVLRHILVHMMLGKELGSIDLQEDYERLEEMILEHEKLWIEKRLIDCLRKLIHEKYNNDSELENYLSVGLHDFVTELYIAAQNRSLIRVVVI